MKRPAMLLRRLFPLLLIAMPARADRIDLSPSAAQVTIRLYGLGLLPINGKYTRFEGWLAYDPIDRTHCQARLTIDAASLTMSSAVVRDDVVGPEFMDATRYPTLTFDGACHDRTLDGSLTMHGISHAFALAMDWRTTEVTATGSLKRAEWGMTQHLLLGGSTVRIQVTAVFPRPAPPPVAAGAPRP
jgi:polyisoprenoid-binding protein YceI